MIVRRLSFVALIAIASMFAGCSSVGVMPQDAKPAMDMQKLSDGHGSVSLAIREKGKGDPVIMLHGLGASSYTWRHVQDGLARTHHVIAIDFKGFGQSEKPLDGHYSITDQARLIGEFIRERNLRGVTLIGHSFGGAVALTMALKQKDAGERRIKRLVLVDTVAYRQPMPFFFKMLRTPVIGEIGMELVPSDVQISKALASAYYNKNKIEQDTVANYAAALDTEGGRHALFHTINSFEPDKADFVAARYHEMKLPALLLWCDHDRIVPLRFGRKLARDLPNARIQVIKNCGHIPQEEQPSATLEAVKSFVQ
ncbi:MAG: alpha/beta hydrolase [Alphaproteobacteria bacterium]